MGCNRRDCEFCPPPGPIWRGPWDDPDIEPDPEVETDTTEEDMTDDDRT